MGTLTSPVMTALLLRPFPHVGGSVALSIVSLAFFGWGRESAILPLGGCSIRHPVRNVENSILRCAEMNSNIISSVRRRLFAEVSFSPLLPQSKIVKFLRQEILEETKTPFLLVLHIINLSSQGPFRSFIIMQVLVFLMTLMTALTMAMPVAISPIRE
jgi:hypothetical protein